MSTKWHELSTFRLPAIVSPQIISPSTGTSGSSCVGRDLSDEQPKDRLASQRRVVAMIRPELRGNGGFSEGEAENVSRLRASFYPLKSTFWR